jgi:outer membrane protein
VFEKCIHGGKLIFLSLLFVATHSSASFAVNTGDLLYYYNLALKNDPQLLGAQYESLATRETLQQAYAGLLPKIYGELNYSRTYQDIKSSDNDVYDTGSTDYDTFSYGVNLVQPIFRYSSFISVGQAKSVLNRSALELEKARQDLALRVAEAYMDILLSKDKLAAVKAEESALEQHYLRAKERSEKGMVPITDRYDTEARLAAVSAQRVVAENLLKDASQALTEICGVPALEIKPLQEDLPLTQPFPENINDWTTAALKQNLEIMIQKLKEEIAGKEVTRQRAAHYPTVDLQAYYMNRDTKGSLFGGGSNTNDYEFLIKLNVPIYEGGIVNSKTREADNLHQSAVQGVIKQNRAAERMVRVTYNGVVSAITRALAMKKSIDAQQLVVEAKEEGFKAGLYISIAVLDAMQDLYRYKREFSQARNDYILNSFKLKHVVGTLKPDELALVNGWLKN